MRQFIVMLIEFLSGGKIRGQHNFYPGKGSPSLRWWYTGTKRYGHGGWVFLSRSWFGRHGSAA